MPTGTKEKPTARRRGKPIEVWVTDEEKAAIKERADEAGISRSGYLRALGLNTPNRSVVDLTVVAYSAEVNGDLGRVAGLLSFGSRRRTAKVQTSVEVEKMMVNFRVLQAQVRGLMSESYMGGKNRLQHHNACLIAAFDSKENSQNS